MAIKRPSPLLDAIDALSLPPYARVLVAVSGGPDSVALALAMHARSAASDSPIVLRLGHVNHALRGSDADEDEEFVIALGKRLQVEVVSRRVDTKAYATLHRMSIETAARELRYSTLRQMLQSWKGDLIAVGHHSGDQAETVLMNMIRGAGLDGLAAMSVRAGDIVRPFLYMSKHTITEGLDTAGERYKLDGSNVDATMRRNYVRHRVLPVLEAVRPGVGDSLARTATRVGVDRAYLAEESERALMFANTWEEPGHVSAELGAFRALHPALQSRALRTLVGVVKGNVRDLDEGHVVLMRAAIMASEAPRSIADQLPPPIRFEVVESRFHISLAKPVSPDKPFSGYLLIPGEFESPFGHFDASVTEHDSHEDRARELAVCGPHHAFCDAEVAGAHLLIRRRRPGDRMLPLHVTGSRKVQDLFVDAKIPRRRRDGIPVLQNEKFIVWIPGFGVDRRAAVTADTKRVAHLRYRPFL